jgi:hypothetical protein
VGEKRRRKSIHERGVNKDRQCGKVCGWKWRGEAYRVIQDGKKYTRRGRGPQRVGRWRGKRKKRKKSNTERAI